MNGVMIMLHRKLFLIIEKNNIERLKKAQSLMEQNGLCYHANFVGIYESIKEKIIELEHQSHQ